MPTPPEPIKSTFAFPAPFESIVPNLDMVDCVLAKLPGVVVPLRLLRGNGAEPKAAGRRSLLILPLCHDGRRERVSNEAMADLLFHAPSGSYGQQTGSSNSCEVVTALQDLDLASAGHYHTSDSLRDWPQIEQTQVA